MIYYKQEFIMCEGKRVSNALYKLGGSSCYTHSSFISDHNLKDTVNYKIFVVRIFSDSMGNVKIKHLK